MWLLRAASSLAFLSLIVFTIPLTFDVGGKDCGLVFSLALSSYYFLYSLIRLATPEGSRIRSGLAKTLRFTQWPTILILMIWSMNKFSVDSNNAASSWVEKTFRRKILRQSSYKLWLLGQGGVVESMAINGWATFLRWATPVFQIMEGFSSLLVIQACGQITKWLVSRERGDSWMIGLLGLSSAIFSSSLYFLWRITTFPELNSIDALLIGATITCVIILGAWGIFNGRGNPVESSLLFAYVTLCIYQIFTDYMPSHPTPAATPPVQPAYPPLPPVLMATYSTFLHYLSSLPTAMHASFNFVWAVVMTITPSVIIALIYRVFVMYAAVRIIPAVRESGARALAQDPALDTSDEVDRFVEIMSWFSPSILIAVYTSLLLQHFSSSNGNKLANGPSDWWTIRGGDAGGNLWRWINIILVQAVYAVELYLSRDETIVPHWKVD